MTAILVPILTFLGGALVAGIAARLLNRRDLPLRANLRLAVEGCRRGRGDDVAADSASTDPRKEAARLLVELYEELGAARDRLRERESELERTRRASAEACHSLLRCFSEVETLFEESGRFAVTMSGEARHFAAAATEISGLVSESSEVSSFGADEQEKSSVAGERLAAVVRELQHSLKAEIERNRQLETLGESCRELVKDGVRRAAETASWQRTWKERGDEIRTAARSLASRSLDLRQTVSDMEKGSASLLSIVLHAGEDLEDLGRRSNEIRSILNYLGDVAEETNLLALNAAIIAAEAGPEGRGFGVVAEEIRELSERTGSSTREIAGLLDSVHEKVRAAESGFRKGCERSADGRELIQRAAGNLEELVREAERMATATSELTGRRDGEDAGAASDSWESLAALLEAFQSARVEREEERKHFETLLRGLEESVTTVRESVTRQSEAAAQLSGRFIRLQNLTGPLQKIGEHHQQVQDGAGGRLTRFRALSETLRADLDRLASLSGVGGKTSATAADAGAPGGGEERSTAPVVAGSSTR